jgi:hypothetical protein
VNGFGGVQLPLRSGWAQAPFGPSPTPVRAEPNPRSG